MNVFSLQHVTTSSCIGLLMILISCAKNPAQVPANVWSVQPLKSARDAFSMPKMSTNEKSKVIQQAHFLFDNIYPFKNEKEKSLGFKVSPLLNDLEAKSADMTSDEFMESLAIIFAKFEDIHLRVRYPEPHQCLRADIPFTFARVTTESGKSALVVKDTYPEILNAHSEDEKKELSEIKVGDVLSSYDGSDPIFLIESRSQGSLQDLVEAESNDVGRERAIALLSSRTGKSVPMPKKDAVKLVFQKSDGSSRSEIQVRWMASSNDDCTTKNTPAAPGTSKSSYNTTNEPTLKWARVLQGAKSVGWVKVSSFNPEASNDTALAIISDILTTNLADVDGIILDMRGNRGGDISYSSLLPKLFSATYRSPVSFRYRNTPFLRTVFANVPWDAWRADEAKGSFDGVDENEPYSRTTQYVSAVEIDAVKTVSNKPVAVLVDAWCASSCDMFAANFQEHKIGKVWSVNSSQTTGAGANATNYNYTAENIKKFITTEMDTLPKEIDFSFPRSQAIKPGTQSILIEGGGVKSDFTYTLSLEDVLTSGEHVLTAISDKFLESLEK